MNFVICDVCGEPIKANGHVLTFTKRLSVFDDIENKYDVCNDCYNKMITLWNKTEASVRITVSK